MVFDPVSFAITYVTATIIGGGLMVASGKAAEADLKKKHEARKAEFERQWKEREEALKKRASQKD